MKNAKPSLYFIWYKRPFDPIHLLAFAFLICLSGISGNAQPTGYGYAKSITINASRVSGPLTSFPVLISVTDPNLRTVGNGGRVQNTNGFDIVFTSSPCGATLLSHQIEQYNATTGQYIAWVNIPSLSNVSNTMIYMFYGNASVAANPSTTATWDASYRGVWHFNNTVNDATSNARNLTNNATSNLASGIIGQGRDLNNSTNAASSGAGQYLQLPNGSMTGITNFTFEGWVLLDRDNTDWERIFDFGQNTNSNFFFTPSAGNGSPAETRVRITTGGNATEQGPVITNATVNTGSWIHWAVVLNDAADQISVYRNGTLYGQATGVTFTPNSLGTNNSNYFGRSQYGVDHYIDAKFDEFRISNTNRSASWIATAYNNQSSPSTFYSFSSEFTATNLCIALPVTIFQFSVEAIDKKSHIRWSATCVNTAQFQVQRSVDGKQWQAIETINVDRPGQTASFVVVDPNPQAGYTYYRIRETDRNGEIDYSATRSLFSSLETGKISVLPNPASEYLHIEWLTTPSAGNLQMGLFDMQGRQVSLPYRKEANGLVCEVKHLPKGIYVLKIKTPAALFTEKVVIE